jgi:hypothetical protein
MLLRKTKSNVHNSAVELESEWRPKNERISTNMSQ